MGVGIGIIIDGKLFYGKSGYSGEFGHSPVFDNEVMCQCGKKGCFETETSGRALERKFREKLKSGSKSILSSKKPIDEIVADDILKAVIENEDTLAIEIINDIGTNMGRYLSILINIFNPELMVLGGILAETGVYIRLPIKSAIHKYSISLVNQDMEMKVSALGSKAGVTGACYILRDKLIYGV
jgi:predicted NBD/HSP70 family sugar kinase